MGDIKAMNNVGIDSPYRNFIKYIHNKETLKNPKIQFYIVVYPRIGKCL